MSEIRRLVYRHTAGPYVGLCQILGIVTPTAVFFNHIGEIRAHTGPMPDMLAPVPMWPDGRLSKGIRLKTTDTYLLYQERALDAKEAPAA